MKSGFFTKTFNSWEISTMNLISPILKMAAHAGNNLQKITHMGWSSVADPLNARQVLKVQDSHEFKTEFPLSPVLEATLKSTIKIKFSPKSYG